MPTTPNRGYPYLAPTDAPDIALATQQLATKLDQDAVKPLVARINLAPADPGNHLSTDQTWIPISNWTSQGVLSGGLTWDTATGITVHRDGYYFLTGQAAFDNSSSGGTRGVTYVKNGGVFGAGGQTVVGDDASVVRIPAPTFPLLLAAGDVINLAVYKISPGQLYVVAGFLAVIGL